MQVLFEYLLKLSISLGVVYLFYITLLRRLTFYNSNRWYLLFYSMLCFYIPFINLSVLIGRDQLHDNNVLLAIPALEFSKVANLNDHVEQNNPGLVAQWLPVILIAGTLILLVRLFVQYISFLQLKKKATLIHTEGVKIYQVDRNIIPFSMGNSIFLNSGLQSNEGLKEIIRHEFVHVKQKHSLDILFTEILCIINWYNPFAWMIRNAVRQNLEFIADNNVLQNGFDKKEYQYLLLKVIGVSHFSIASKFNFSSLKKRIVMMNKLKSAKVHLFKFLFVLPLIAVLLLAFRENYNSNKAPGKTESNSMISKDSIPPAKRVQGSANPDTLYWLKAPAGVKKMSLDKKTATVVLKSGTIEEYNLDDKTQLDSYIKKYGAVPSLPTEEMWKKAAGQEIKISSDPVYIVNGELVTDIKNINPNDLESVQILKGEPAIKAYGEKGKNGVIKLSSKTKISEVPIIAEGVEIAEPIVSETGEMIVTDVRAVKSIVVVKGVPAKVNGDIKEMVSISVTPAKVTEVASQADVVVRGYASRSPIGTQEVVVTGYPSSRSVAGRLTGVQVKGQPIAATEAKTATVREVSTENMLYIIDGKEVTTAEMKTLQPANIGSINILTGKDAEKQYGEKGKNGVILVTTKKVPTT